MEILRKWYRSSRDKKLTGLCGGIGEMLNIDSTLIRILLIVFTIFTSGAGILIYIIASAVVPKEPIIHTGFGPNNYGNGGYGSNGANNGNGYGNGNGNGYGNGYGNSFNNMFGSNPNAGGPYKNPPHSNPPNSNNNWEAPMGASPQFDSMMDELEKKALRKEIEQLKEKLAKLEKGDL